MPKPYASAVLPVSADRLWAYLRDFSNIADWHPAIATGEMESGTGDQVGSVRLLHGSGGETFRERLLALDDAERSCTYELFESPFPIRAYRSTLRVTPVTDGGQAFAEWWAWYDSDAKDEEWLTKTFSQGVFGTGLTALRERFS
jgi:hypothetical protein